MIRTFIMAFAAIVVASCAAPLPPADTLDASATFVGIDGKPLVSAQGVVDHSVQEALTANPDACAKAGGSLKPVCRMQRPICLITFQDAGKDCTDGSQCGSGRCTSQDAAGKPGPAKGQCTATNDPCGCYTRIEDGAAQPTICVD